jgi:hypothetical protein
MNSTSTEGLGLSLAIYLAVLFGGLTLVVWPIYYANSPTVIENTAQPMQGSPLAKPLYADHRGEAFPLALLKKPDIVDAQSLAALNSYAKAPAAQPRRAAATTVTARQPREHTASSDYASEQRPQQQRRSFFPFFSLF